MVDFTLKKFYQILHMLFFNAVLLQMTLPNKYPSKDSLLNYYTTITLLLYYYIYYTITTYYIIITLDEILLIKLLSL